MAETSSSCPLKIDFATRLVSVVTPTMASPVAELRIYGREFPTEEWMPIGEAAAATVGRKGLGWSFEQSDHGRAGEPRKTEGDARSPAGLFPVGVPFGTDGRGLDSYMPLRPGLVCIDDPESARYGQVYQTSEDSILPSHEKMWETALYRQGLVVEAPVSQEARSGSCIFLHVWRDPGQPTSGCVAADGAVVRSLQEELNGHRAAIAILPRDAAARYAGCDLPPLDGT